MKAKKDGLDPTMCQEMTLNRNRRRSSTPTTSKALYSMLNEPVYSPISTNQPFDTNFNKDPCHLINLPTGCI